MGRKKKPAKRVVLSVSVPPEIATALKNLGVSPTYVFKLGWGKLMENSRNKEYLDVLEDELLPLIARVRRSGKKLTMYEFIQEFKRFSDIAMRVPITDLDFLKYLEDKYNIKIVEDGEEKEKRRKEIYGKKI